MKKTYDSPKAEKLEFQYEDVVVASRCTGHKTYDVEYTYNEGQEGCTSTTSDPYNQSSTAQG